MSKNLKIIPLGGLGEIGKNMTVFEYGRNLIIVDCGVKFPENDQYGIDLVLPQFDYILKNQSTMRGIVLTHGHQDHIGGLPYLLERMKAPESRHAPSWSAYSIQLAELGTVIDSLGEILADTINTRITVIGEGFLGGALREAGL